MQTAVLEARSTAAKPAAKKRSAPLDPKMATKLLDLLSSDDSYRHLFERNPRAALALLGHSLPITCGPLSSLASKLQFASARTQLVAHICSAGLFRDPHCFEAGTVPGAFIRK